MRTLVTGANGHLGFNLVEALRRDGHRVRAGVRSLADADKTARLRALAGVELVEAELGRPEQLRAAMDGVEVLFHAAAVYDYTTPGREAEILEASIRGTEHALRAAADAGVHKVVLTSSVVTLPFVAPGAPPSDESLVGPGFVRNTPSIDVVETMAKGALRLGAPDMNFPLVDVRDVVAAHLLAAKRDVTGRFAVVDDVHPTFREMLAALHSIDATIPLPLMTMPRFATRLLPLVDRLNAVVLGTPTTLSGELAASLDGKVWGISNRRSRETLGWRPSIPMEQALRDTLATLRARH